MKIIVILLICLIFPFYLSKAESPFRTYYAKYIYRNGETRPSESIVTVTPDNIYVDRNGEKKNFWCTYKGVVTHKESDNVSFNYHHFHLYKKDINLLVSERKIMKNNGVFYYIIIIDNQIQLAL